MDNEIKIKNAKKDLYTTKKEVQLFLEEELKPIKHNGKQISRYNLEEEFAKTKKNKSPFILLVLLGCLIAVALVTFIFFKNVSKENRTVSIDADVFTDLDVSHIFSEYTKTQTIRTTIQNEYDKYVSLRNIELTLAENESNAKKITLDSLNLESKSDYNTKKNIINNDYINSKNLIHATYDSKIDELEKKLKEYDSKLSNFAKSTNNIEDLQSKVFDEEKNKIINSYNDYIITQREKIDQLQEIYYKLNRQTISEIAKKYQSEVAALDPIISNAIADSYIEEADNYKQATSDSDFFINYLDFLPEALKTDTVIAESDNIKQLYEKYDYLHKTIADLPQKNTMPSYINAEQTFISKISNSLGTTFSTIIDNLYNLYSSLQKDKKIVDNLNTSLKNDNLKLKNQNSSFLSQLTNIKTENDALKNKNASLLAENTSLIKQNTFLVDENNSINLANTELITERNLYSTQLEAYIQLFNTTLKQNKVDGFVMSAIDSNSVRVFISDDSAIAFTNEVQSIPAKLKKNFFSSFKGTVQKKDSIYIFSPEDPEKIAEINPLDTITLSSLDEN